MLTITSKKRFYSLPKTNNYALPPVQQKQPISYFAHNAFNLNPNAFPRVSFTPCKLSLFNTHKAISIDQKKFCTTSSKPNKNFKDNIYPTRKLFWSDPYRHTINTKVAAVNDDQVFFEETIAYSFSGGQESDKATVNGIPIINSKMVGHSICYILPENHGLSAGDKVTMVIDWNRRYKLMRLHFAAELVLEIVIQKFQLQKVGAHISETKARIDFIFDKHISFLFETILMEYNEIIKSDKLIETGFSDITNQRRFWKIDNFAKVPCGGTHVKSTGEVGLITLKRTKGGKKDGKTVERIEIKLIDDSVSNNYIDVISTQKNTL